MIRILSLDDEPEMVDLLGLILKRAGYEHAGTSDNRKAWAMLHAEPFDLFTQDLMRPDIDGWEFYRMMKSDTTLHDLPVIIITAKAQSIDKVLGLDVEEADAYVTKPFGPLELLAAVENVLRKHGKPPPTEAAQVPWFRQPIAKREQDIESLVGALGDKDRKMRASTVRKLGSLKDERAVEPLIGMLRDRDREVRWSATRALGAIGDPKAVEPLIRMLEGKDREGRRAAALALGEIGDRRVVEPLVAALRSRSGYVRYAAAWALGNLKDERAVESLIGALHDEVQGIDQVAVRSLAHIGGPAVEPLIEKMGDASAQTRKAAAEVLGQIRDRRAVEPLIAALRDGNADVRRTAAWYLGYMEDKRAVEPLIAALRDEMKGRRPVKPLVATLRDENAVVCTVIRSLGCLKDERAVEPLVAALQDENADVVWKASDALSMIGDARAIPHLERVAREDTRKTLYGAAIADMAKSAVERTEAAQQREQR